jgi:hypothetical protein
MLNNRACSQLLLLISLSVFETVRLIVVLAERTVTKFGEEVTHIVAEEDDEGKVGRTTKYLKGVLAGRKVVSIKWVTESLLTGKPDKEELHLVQGSSRNPASDGPKRSLINHFYNFPRLFAGCNFCLEGDFRDPATDILSELIDMSGGLILSRKPSCFEGATSVPFHAQKLTYLKNACYYIISDVDNFLPRVAESSPRVAFCSKNWVLDCFDQYEIIDANAFVDSSEKVDSVESLEHQQSIRNSRSRMRGTGDEYFMSL